MSNDIASILIVDDSSVNRMILQNLVTTLGHKAVMAEDGVAALNYIRKEKVDVVLLDILMPKMNGMEVLKFIKNDKELRHTPVIMITAIDDANSIIECTENGADDYLNKPFNATLLRARIRACLDKKRLHDVEDDYRKHIETYNKQLEIRVYEQVREITSMQWATIFVMAKLAESRDSETGQHLLRMKEYCRILTKKLRTFSKYRTVIDDKFIEIIYDVSPLHDIGKIGIPDSILLQKGKLSKEDTEVMKTHVLIGAKTLREVERQFPGNEFIRAGIGIVEGHHERWDGTGYPKGLSGAEIPFMGRIATLADVYDALTSRRVYKEPIPHDDCFEMIVTNKGEKFDPDVVDAFVSTENEFVKIKDLFADPK